MKLIVMRSVRALSRSSSLQSDISPAEGKKHAHKVAELLRVLNLIPNKIITSSLDRCKNTGKEIANFFDQDIKTEESTHILPGCNTTDFLKTVRNYSEDINDVVILTVLHNPDMRAILGELMFPDSKFQLRILNGDVCILDISFNDTSVITRLCSYFSPCLLSEMLNK